MRPSLVLPTLVLACALALGGCHKIGAAPAGGEANATEAAHAAYPAPIVVTPAYRAASDFVDKAADNDLYAMRAGQMAAAHARTPAVLSFAKQMTAQHAAALADLKRAAAASGPALTPPTQPSERRQALLDMLGRDDPPADFDRTYVEQEVEAEGEALKLATAYATDGGLPPLKAAATDRAAAVQSNLDRARALEDALNNSKAP